MQLSGIGTVKIGFKTRLQQCVYDCDMHVLLIRKYGTHGMIDRQIGYQRHAIGGQSAFGLDYLRAYKTNTLGAGRHQALGGETSHELANRRMGNLQLVSERAC